MDFSNIHLVIHLGMTFGLIVLSVALGALVLNRQGALRAAREAEQNFRELYENIGEGVFRATLDGVILRANPALCRILGYASEMELLEHQGPGGSRYVEQDRQAAIREMLFDKGVVTGLVSEVMCAKRGAMVWVEESLRLVRDQRTGEPRYYDGTLRDVSATAGRVEIQKRFEQIAAVAPGCLYQQRTRPDGSHVVTYASVGIEKLMGLTPDQARRHPDQLTSLVHPDDRGALLESFRHSIATMTERNIEYRIILKDGTQKWVSGHSVPQRESDGAVLWHGFLADVTERKLAEARIYDLAYLDTLTQLPNRASLVAQLQATIDRHDPEANWKALLFIDLDQFKVLNDTKGHSSGDLLLVEVAKRLKSVVNDGDLVARLGGDEFVVLMGRISAYKGTAEARIHEVVERLQGAVSAPFVLEGFPFRTSASVGAAMFRGAETGVSELLRRADTAMYDAKAAGRGSLSFFVPEMQAALEERASLTTELREALEAGKGLSLEYQPQVDEAGQPFGVEALLRWDHPERGLIMPSEFIPLAERAGLSPLIDEFVLNAACQTLYQWGGDPAMRMLEMGVNIGSQQIDGGIVEQVRRTLYDTGASPSRLTIELTERVMLDNMNEVSAALAGLKQLGVRLAFDDFGTGYSSLAHFKKLPIDIVKIDHSFVRDIETNQNDRVVVQTILNIARNLGLTAIAEGIENEMQALLLRRFGCRAFQGFHYGRPMPAGDVERWCKSVRRPRGGVLPPTRLVV